MMEVSVHGFAGTYRLGFLMTIEFVTNINVADVKPALKSKINNINPSFIHVITFLDSSKEVKKQEGCYKRTASLQQFLL